MIFLNSYHQFKILNPPSLILFYISISIQSSILQSSNSTTDKYFISINFIYFEAFLISAIISKHLVTSIKKKLEIEAYISQHKLFRWTYSLPFNYPTTKPLSKAPFFQDHIHQYINTNKIVFT